MSANAEENDANQSKFYKVISSKPVTNADTLFDTLSKFLTKDKKRQIAMEFLDEKDLISSRLTWNNIRNVANTVIEEGCSQRDPIPAWIEEKEAIVVDETPNTYSGDADADVAKEESDPVPKEETGDGVKMEPKVETPESETKEDKKAAKKAKREAKEARKRERAEKREAKKIKREEKEARKLKKEAKKRKREE